MPHITPPSCLVTTVLTVNPTQNKQQLARRNCRKTFVFVKWIWGEQVCFAGSGSLPLLPRPRGCGCFQGLAGGVEKRGGLAVSWMSWQQKPPAQSESGGLQTTGPVSWRQTPTDHKTCVRVLNKLSAHCYGSTDHHHGKRSSLSVPVCSINSCFCWNQRKERRDGSGFPLSIQTLK